MKANRVRTQQVLIFKEDIEEKAEALSFCDAPYIPTATLATGGKFCR